MVVLTVGSRVLGSADRDGLPTRTYETAGRAAVTNGGSATRRGGDTPTGDGEGRISRHLNTLTGKRNTTPQKTSLPEQM